MDEAAAIARRVLSRDGYHGDRRLGAETGAGCKRLINKQNLNKVHVCIKTFPSISIGYFCSAAIAN
jgi:hypothetical protein